MQGGTLIEVLTTARNASGACHPPSETTVRRQLATPRRQPQHPRSSAPKQSPSRTVYNSLAGPLEAALAFAKFLPHTDPNAACIPSSQPPLLKCCDDRLNPPWVARSSRAMTVEDVAKDIASPSRGTICPRFAQTFSLEEGAGNAGRTLHPRSRVQ